MNGPKSPLENLIDLAVEQARGPVAVDRRAAAAPVGSAAFSSPLTGHDETGRPYRIFVPGLDAVGDPEVVIGGAD